MIYLILAILATYRIAHMVAQEDGPFDVFSRIRSIPNPESWIARGLNCVLCISFWVSLLAALLLAHQDPTMQRSETLLTWLGIAGAVMVLHLWTER